jgi:hypothetical protein
LRDLWFARDLPVLEVVVDQFEISDRPLLGLPRIAELSGIDITAVGKACLNLQKAGHIELVTAMSGSDYSPWYVKDVSSAALVATGAWPSAESLSKDIIEELMRTSDGQGDQDEPGWLKKILSGAGEVSREVFTRVMTEAIIRVLTPGR